MHYFSLDRQFKYLIEIVNPDNNQPVLTDEHKKRKEEFDKSCSAYPNSPDCKQYNLGSLRKSMDDMGILDPYMRAALIGNVQKESGDFKWINESEYANDKEVKKYTARNYGMGNPRKQQELGNRSGTEDYYNFRGFGPIQITGRANWEKYAKKANLLKPNETIDEFQARVRGKSSKDSDVEAAFKMSIAYIQDRFQPEMNKLARGMDQSKAMTQFANEAMIRAINPGLFSYAKPEYKPDIQKRIDYSNTALKVELARPAIQLEYLGLNKPNSQPQKSDSNPKGPTLETPDSDDGAIKEKTPAKKQSSTYEVKDGDNLSKIAKNHGLTLEQLKAANPQIKDPNKIKSGQKLNLPSK